MKRITFGLALFALILPLRAYGQTQTKKITSPKEEFRFNLGDDYQLANYKQLVQYWSKLDRESNRMSLEEIGKTSEGRPIMMATITSPENHKKLALYREIARKLALAEELTEADARTLAAEGKTVVWIDGGLHATEVLGAQQLMELVYQMVSLNDRETLRILDDVIVLAVCVNPDGLDLVADWYMRKPKVEERSASDIPRLYQKYAGHDNNRDFYMSNLPESEAINRVQYQVWFPQIVYNHHQSGPAGTVMFAPPFRDPFNHNLDPLIPLGLDQVGSAMHQRFAAEGKPGVTMRSGSTYSTWWNGGLRTTPYFHNMIGLLTETIGSPTPMEIPFLPEKQLPSADLPLPIAPQKWHFRQSIDYSITANRAVLDFASERREDLLFNIYRMAKNSIERGSRDSWTRRPRAIEALQAQIAKDKPQATGEGRSRGMPLKYYEMLNDEKARDPRAYVIPSSQPDFLTATKFVSVLIKNGVAVHRASASFTASGKTYPAGSFVVKTAQAFRPHVLDMFEPQDHPDDFAYPGGPPKPPYDSAGYTLAYQMGVEFDRVLDALDAPLEKTSGLVKPAAGRVNGSVGASGYFLTHQANDAFVAVNRLLASGEEVLWLKQPASVSGKTLPPGTMFIPAGPSTRPKLEKIAAEIGLTFEGTPSRPKDAALLKSVRVGLWDRYGGSMPSGWVRYVLEEFEFPFEVVYASTLDAGNLRSKYDVLIFVDGAIPASDRAGQGGFGGAPPAPASIPEEYRSRLENVTVAKTVPHVRKFIEDGGTVLAVGSSTSLGYHLGLPIANQLVERAPNEAAKPLPREKFYVPGSVLQATVDTSHPLAYGLPELVDVYFDESPAFKLLPEAATRDTRAVLWFATEKPLRSGWAWGQNYLEGGAAVVEAKVGRGRLVLIGPEITFRAQPHGTFKLLFNGIYSGAGDGSSQVPVTAGK